MPIVFMSYSNNDREKVTRLAKVLSQDNNIQVWIDTEEIFPGDDLVEKMKEGIRKADRFLICLSPSFDEKPPTSWVKDELRMAILREKESAKNIIIPVRIKKGGKIPEEIGTRAYADLTTRKRWSRNLTRLIQAIEREA